MHPLPKGSKVLGESNDTLLYLSVLEGFDGEVVIKALKSDDPSPRALERLRNELAYTKDSKITGVRKSYDLIKLNGKDALVLEFIPGESLKSLAVQRFFTLEIFLKVGVELCDLLGKIHKNNIVHRDFNSNNILLNPNDLMLSIIDFENATSISVKANHLGNPGTLEGTLQYISPEQTGRMNRTVDYRTDLYSLGISLYETLTGRLPFETHDPLELVHYHLAKTPVSPSIINTSIPESVSSIILKLLSKNAEDRYQSAFGVKADLEYCLYQYLKKGTVEPFALATHDESSSFNIPQKLYGREVQVEQLLETFERVYAGTKCVTFVTGASGTGKSVLVSEIHKPITKRRGYFASGKYDELKRNIPYYAIINALNELIDILLTEPSDALANWKETFTEACGTNGQVLIEVMPKLEMIMGPQPDVQPLSPFEARNRFNYVFRNFIKCIATQEHPLVVFLDDLQWADIASIDFLKVLLSDYGEVYLMFIGSYRSNEVDEMHPIYDFGEHLRKTDIEITEIRVEELSTENIALLIEDTLQCDRKRSLPLAELIHGKTLGNAFFVNQFLLSLYEKGLLHFDFESGRRPEADSPWQWDLGEIERLNITDNVVKLVSDKILELPDDLQVVLQLASCIGTKFDFETLKIISHKGNELLSSIILLGIREGLINPINAQGGILGDLPFATSNVEFKFSHDKVHQAAYNLLPTTEQQRIHHEIGNLLLNGLSDEEVEERIFDIVNHLNHQLAKTTKERLKLVGLYLMASNKSKQSGGFVTALSYIKVCLELLDKSAWAHSYDLTLEVHTEASEVAYLTGEYALMDDTSKEVRQKAKGLMEVIRVNEIVMQAYHAQGLMDKTIDLALVSLQKLGVKLPKHPSQFQILIGLGRLRLALIGTPPEKLYDLPEMQDARMLAAIRILTGVIPAAYYARPNLFPLIVFKQVFLSLKYGNTEYSPFAYVTYGIVLSAVLKNQGQGYEFGLVSTRLLKKFETKKQVGRTTVAFNSFLRHWKVHLKDVLGPMEDTYSLARECGDLEYAAVTAFNQSFISFCIGKNLEHLDKKTARLSQNIKELNQHSSLSFIKLVHQAINNLIDVREEPWVLEGPVIREEDILSTSEDSQGQTNSTALFILYFQKAFLSLYFRNEQVGVAFIDKAGEHLDAVISSWLQSIYYFLDSLIKLGAYEAADKSEREIYMRRVLRNQKLMKKWSELAPSNQLQRYQLIEAERHRVLGFYSKARNYYDQAIDSARKNEYIQEEGLAYELAGEFYIANKQSRLGIFYLSNAYRAYKQWGAIAKLNDLEVRFPQLLVPNYQSVINRSNMLMKSVKTDGDKSSQVLDLNSVVKASQMLSSEIVLESLLQRLLRIVMENAGAEKGFLIDNDIESLNLLVKGQVSNNEVVSELVNAEHKHPMPKSILNYVARTKTSVVLNNASKDVTYGNDAYVQEYKPKSVICYPVLRKEQLSCIIYLENNLVPGAFTTERLEVLNILASQIAISIENALLYENLEEKVRERTTEIQSKSIELEQQKEEIIAQRDMLEMVNEEITRRRDEINDKNKELELAQDEILEKNEELVRINNNLEEIVSERTRELKIALHKLLESNKELDTFIYRASHDLKGPISRILGLAYIGKLELNNEADVDNLDRIETTATEMDRMLSKLIKVHLIFKEEVNYTSIDIQQMLDEILTSFQMRIEESNIKIELDIEARTKMVSDSNLVRMILENLIENGVVFHRIQHNQSRKLSIRVRDQVERVIFEIEDNGEGMDIETRKNIYNMFFRGSNRSHGNGLGLYLVKKAVEKLNGDVESNSEPGAGTTFTVMIPDKLVTNSFSN